ncbi:MAG TPA: clostripain-related cysteine peptidase [Roseiflexaceae bacterium]|nr:clostripain-related cysteine peptidase [Roseiflexaceae bacterium]
MIRVYRHTHTMMSTRLLVLSLLATLMLPLLSGMPQPIQPPVSTAPEPAAGLPVAEQLARLPLAFEHTAQGAGSAQFQARALGGTLFFAPGEVSLARPGSATLQVRFLGADPAAAIEPSDPLPGRVSRFIGNDPALWQTDLPTSAALVYRQLYPGIDLRYDGASQRLKGTYLVAPWADHSAIRWRYDGAQKPQIGPDGDLLITLNPSKAGGTQQTLTERAPVAWQDTASGRVPVSVDYKQTDDGSFGFSLGQYDPALPLVIDPTLEFSSYLGGLGNDHIYDVAFDPQGNIYVVSDTYAADFQMRPGAYEPTFGRDWKGKRDVVVLKLSPTGTTVLASTYLGGTEWDWDPHILVDGRGITVVGNTESANFPTTLANQKANGGNDIFVTRLDTNGTKLLWSRYLGGSNRDVVNGAVLDAQGRVTFVGTTQSTNFPEGSKPPHQQNPPGARPHTPVVVQLDSEGTITFHTFLNDTSYVYGSAIALAPDGSIVVGGERNNQGSLDVFIDKFEPGATVPVTITRLGGQHNDGLLDLTVDSAGAIYAVGKTESVDFLDRTPGNTSTGADGYMVKLSPEGKPVSTHFEAGNGTDEIRRVALDRQGNVYLLGITTSDKVEQIDPPNPTPAPQNDKSNILLVKLASDGQTVLSRSLLGGDRLDEAWALAVTPTGQVALGGFTYSTALPLRNELQKNLTPDPSTDAPIEGVLMVIDTAPQLELKGSSNPPALPPCAADLCAPVSFTWTLSTPYRLDTTLAITVPQGLQILPGTVSGATLSGNILRANGSPQPDSPLRVGYQALPKANLLPGSMLTTVAHARTPDGLLFERNLTVALPAPAPRTLVLIYASGDNNLRDAMQLLADKVKRTASLSDVVGLLVLDGPGPDDASLYNTLTKTSQHWPDSVANPDTLADFLISAQQAFPATRRVLSLVGHGGGWAPNVLDIQPDRHPGQPSRHGGQDSGNLGGMLWDDNPASSLSTVELARALKTSKDATGSTFDLLYLDACNMAQIEVAYQLRGSAHFLLASPNWKWAAFPYDQHLQDAAKDGGKQIGEAWIANEREALAEHKDEPYTFTLLNLDQIGTLRNQAETLARSLMGQPQERIRTAFRQADRYDGNQDGVLDERDTTVDLGSFAARLEVELGEQLDAAPVLDAARQVQQTLKSVVVEFSKLGGKPWLPNSNTWQWRDTTTAGLPIYLPLGQQDDWRRRYYGSMDFGQDGNKDSAWAMLVDWLWDGAAPPEDPICGQPCTPLGPQLRPVSLPRPIFLPLVRR